MLFKNVASQSVALFAFDSTTGAPKTGDAANLVIYITKDWGSVTAVAANSGVPTEMDSTNAKGWYKIAISQTESNADAIVLSGKSATSNIYVVGQTYYTNPANFGATSINSSGQVDAIKFAGQTITAAAGITFGTTVAATGDAMALTSGERNSTADAFLNRDMSTGTDSGSPSVRTVRQALRFLRNKFAIVAGTMTVYKEDDTTASWTSAITTTAGNPVSTSDPA